MEKRRGIRINRYLAMCGFGARRAVERLVAEGRVRVDGEVVTDLAFRVEAGAKVTVNGAVARARRKFRYVAYYKRRGVLTTARDPFRRRIIKHELPRHLRSLKPVGRLDADTEGLILLTDDGAFAHRVAHPSFGVLKRYVVEVRGCVTRKGVRELERGIKLRDGHIGRVNVETVEAEAESSVVTLNVEYGRKRMLRQMFAALRHRVTRLCRVNVGPVALGELAPGEWRDLTAEEVKILRGQ
ncbi:MAG: pseudouridine synthase [Candidatus Zixiibacteriota bacterium]|jgi:23S rRNA pseudouridine2605 synthase